MEPFFSPWRFEKSGFYCGYLISTDECTKLLKNDNVDYCKHYFRTLFLDCRTELTTALAHLTKEEKEDPAIRHALLIRSAWALSNYHTFFQLYLNAPNMSGYLLDLFVQRERVQALKAMVKSWVVFVLYLLGHWRSVHLSHSLLKRFRNTKLSR